MRSTHLDKCAMRVASIPQSATRTQAILQEPQHFKDLMLLLVFDFFEQPITLKM